MTIQKDYRELKGKVSEDFMQQLFIELTEEEYREGKENCALIPPKGIKRSTLYSSAYGES